MASKKYVVGAFALILCMAAFVFIPLSDESDADSGATTLNSQINGYIDSVLGPESSMVTSAVDGDNAVLITIKTDLASIETVSVNPNEAITSLMSFVNVMTYNGQTIIGSGQAGGISLFVSDVVSGIIGQLDTGDNAIFVAEINDVEVTFDVKLSDDLKKTYHAVGEFISYKNGKFTLKSADKLYEVLAVTSYNVFSTKTVAQVFTALAGDEVLETFITDASVKNYINEVSGIINSMFKPMSTNPDTYITDYVKVKFGNGNYQALAVPAVHGDDDFQGLMKTLASAMSGFSQSMGSIYQLNGKDMSFRISVEVYTGTPDAKTAFAQLGLTAVVHDDKIPVTPTPTPDPTPTPTPTPVDPTPAPAGDDGETVIDEDGNEITTKINKEDGSKTVTTRNPQGKITNITDYIGSTTVVTGVEGSVTNTLVKSGELNSVTVSRAVEQVDKVADEVPVTYSQLKAESDSITVSSSNAATIGSTFDVLVLSKSGTEIELPADVINNLADKGGEIKILTREATSSDMNSAQRDAVGSRFAIRFDATVGGNEVNELGGTVEISFNYLPTGDLVGKTLAVFFVDLSGNKEIMDSLYNDGVMKFVTNHNSIYVVDVVESPAPAPSPAPSSDSGSDITAIAVIAAAAAVIIIAAAAFVFTMRKN